jgi:hypothetical protein
VEEGMGLFLPTAALGEEALRSHAPIPTTMTLATLPALLPSEKWKNKKTRCPRM